METNNSHRDYLFQISNKFLFVCNTYRKIPENIKAEELFSKTKTPIFKSF